MKTLTCTVSGHSTTGDRSGGNPRRSGGAAGAGFGELLADDFVAGFGAGDGAGAAVGGGIHLSVGLGAADVASDVTNVTAGAADVGFRGAVAGGVGHAGVTARSVPPPTPSCQLSGFRRCPGGGWRRGRSSRSGGWRRGRRRCRRGSTRRTG